MPETHKLILDKQITALSDALAKLGTSTTWADVIKIIHHPGYTTPAEHAFTAALINAMQIHVSAVETLRNQMLSACKVVIEAKQTAK